MPIALAGVHPLRKLAIAFLDFKETEVNLKMADVLSFAASCPLLEELQLGGELVRDDVHTRAEARPRKEPRHLGKLRKARNCTF